MNKSTSYILAGAGIVVVAGIFVVGHSLLKPSPQKVVAIGTVPKSGAKSGKKDQGKSGATPAPVATPPANTYTGAIYQMYKYDDQMKQQVLNAAAKDTPGMPAPGPDAGVYTLALVNSKSASNPYHGPKVPDSLNAWGVNPAQYPAKGSILNLGAYVDEMYPLILKQFPTMTKPVYEQMIQTAAKYIVTTYTSDPAGGMSYLDGTWENLAGSSAYELDGAYQAKYTETLYRGTGNDVPWKQYSYDSWVSMTPTPPNAPTNIIGLWGTGMISMPTVKVPSGMKVVYGLILFHPFNIYNLQSTKPSLDANSLNLGEWDVPVTDITMAYVENSNGTDPQWTITNAVASGYTNTPSKVLKSLN